MSGKIAQPHEQTASRMRKVRVPRNRGPIEFLEPLPAIEPDSRCIIRPDMQAQAGEPVGNGLLAGLFDQSGCDPTASVQRKHCEAVDAVAAPVLKGRSRPEMGVPR